MKYNNNVFIYMMATFMTIWFILFYFCHFYHNACVSICKGMGMYCCQCVLN